MHPFQDLPSHTPSGIGMLSPPFAFSHTPSPPPMPHPIAFPMNRQTARELEMLDRLMGQACFREHQEWLAFVTAVYDIAHTHSPAPGSTIPPALIEVTDMYERYLTRFAETLINIRSGMLQHLLDEVMSVCEGQCLTRSTITSEDSPVSHPTPIASDTVQAPSPAERLSAHRYNFGFFDTDPGANTDADVSPSSSSISLDSALPPHPKHLSACTSLDLEPALSIPSPVSSTPDEMTIKFGELSPPTTSPELHSALKVIIKLPEHQLPRGSSRRRRSASNRPAMQQVSTTSVSSPESPMRVVLSSLDTGFNGPKRSSYAIPSSLSDIPESVGADDLEVEDSQGGVVVDSDNARPRHESTSSGRSTDAHGQEHPSASLH